MRLQTRFNNNNNNNNNNNTVDFTTPLTTPLSSLASLTPSRNASQNQARRYEFKQRVLPNVPPGGVIRHANETCPTCSDLLERCKGSVELSDFTSKASQQD